MSLDENEGKELLLANGLIASEDGYFECENLELTVELDEPAEIPKEEWKRYNGPTEAVCR